MSPDRAPGAGPGDGHLDDDALLDLASELLEPAVATTRMAHLRQCPDCEERLRVIVSDRERGRVRIATGEWRRPRAGASSPAHRASRRPWRGAMLGAGALAAALALALVFLRPVRPTLEPAWMPRAGEGLEQRGPSDDAGDAAVWRGLAAYQARDLEAAIGLLASAAPRSEGLERMRRLHLASAYALRGRGREALAALADLDLESLPHPWRGEALWVRAVALDRLGRRDERRVALERLAREPGELGDRARRALAPR